MLNSTETSFIPQQPILRAEGSVRRKEPLNLPFVLALIVFLVTLVVAGGVFFWSKQVSARVQSQSQKLEDAEKLLNIDEIKSYKQVDTRISTVKTLLRNHNVFSIILNLLEEGTAQNVGLTSLNYVKDSDNFILNISGQAPSYEAVYFQGETWKKMKPFVTGVNISGVSLSGESGIVNFTAKIAINNDLIKYSKLLEGEDRARKQAEQTSASTVSTPSVAPTTP